LAYTKKPSIRDILALSKLERLIMIYFLRHISAGEIITVIEIRDEIKRSNDPELVPEFDDIIIELEINKAIARLVEKGFLEHKSGCYSLAEHIREEIMKKYGGLYPGRPKKIEDFL